MAGLFSVSKHLHRSEIFASSMSQVVSLRRRLLRYEPDDEDAKGDDEENISGTAAEGKD